MTAFTVHLFSLFVLYLVGTNMVQTDPEFHPHIETYERLSGKKINSIITFKPKLDGNVIGICYYVTKKIVIDKEWWYQVSNYKHEQLILHELGHCEGLRDHTEKMIYMGEDGFIPISIMHPSIIHEPTYIKYRTYYLEELFNGSK